MVTPDSAGQREHGPAYVARAGEGDNADDSASLPPPPPLRFSSYSLLEGGDAATGSLGLPIGALFAPFARLQPPPAEIPRQPILCTHCAAYPNPFCSVDPATGGWRCCFCMKDNPCYAEDFIGSSPSEHRESYPEMTYKAVEYSEPDLAGVMSSLSLATGPHRRRDRAAAAPAHVLVVDGNMRETALADLSLSVEKALETMEPQALVALVVFTGVVSVYRLGKAGAAVADVFPGGEPLPQQEVEDRLTEGEKDHFVPVHAGKDALCTILKLLRGVGDGSGGRRQGGGSASVEGLNGFYGAGGRAGGQGRQKRTWAASRRGPVPAHRRKRCLGAAVEYALSLAAAAQRPSARVLVCLGGCPNFGPGAVAPCVPGAASAEIEPEALAAATNYFEQLGTRALLQGTGIDIFCGGSEALGAAALQALVAPTGGYVLIQPSFSEQQFASNLSKSIQEQTMSDGDGLHGCIIDVRSSVGMDLLHVVGPAESTEDYDEVDREAEQTSAAAARISEGRPLATASTLSDDGDGLASGGDANSSSSSSSNNDNGKFGLGISHHRLVTGRVDPRTSLALYFDGPAAASTKRGKSLYRRKVAADGQNQEEEEDYVIFQFVVRQARAGEGRITRVLTHRLPVTADEQGFLQTVDPEAVAALVAKEAVLRATYGAERGSNQQEVEEARVAVDAVVHEVSMRYRELRKKWESIAAAAAAASARRNSGGSTTALGLRTRLGSFRDRRSTTATTGAAARTTTPTGGESNSVDEMVSDVEEGEGGGFAQDMEASRSNDEEQSAAAVGEELEGRRGGVVGTRRKEEVESLASPEEMVFPPELDRLPIRLFHLRRGPLLGPLLQNSDDPLCLRHLFLRGALEECLRMMAPEMLSMKATEALGALSNDTAAVEAGQAGGDGGRGSAVEAAATAPVRLPLVPVPVETLAMLPDRILVLDTHDRVFVWSGAAVCGGELDVVRLACKEMFTAESVSRFPSAHVVFLKDGSSWSRYLTSRLIPSHKDPIKDQLKGFPHLASVPAEDLDRLRAKLPLTDDESYREYFWDVCNSGSANGW